jgi:transcriptional regulator with XRE-family HTH domain
METRKYKSYVKSDEENKLHKFMGQRLREARKNIPQLTQVKLAKALGVSFQAIGKYEKGHNGLNPIKLKKISIITNKPYSYFFDDFTELPGFVELPGDDSVSSHSESFENV